MIFSHFLHSAVSPHLILCLLLVQRPIGNSMLLHINWASFSYLTHSLIFIVIAPTIQHYLLLLQGQQGPDGPKGSRGGKGGKVS